MSVTQVARELRNEGMAARVAVRLAKALIYEEMGDMMQAYKYLDAAIEAEEQENS